MTQPRPEPPLAREILRYCARNPATADTREGFARWRLMEEAVARTTAETAEALDWLLARGFLRTVPAVKGSEELLILNEARSAEVAEFLAGAKTTTPRTGGR